MDELSPLFHDIEFNERFRGYDVEEVDAYVDRVAKAAALAQGRIAELQERAAAAEAQPRPAAPAAAPAAGEFDDTRLSRVLVLAQRTADAAIEEAKAEAEAMRIDAAADSERIRREADDHASRVMAEAETDRRRMIAEAEEAAAGAVAAERARVAAEVAELERQRGFLSEDISILEQHLAETRLAVAASVSALTDLIEAPEAFRAPAMPETSGVEVPAGLIEGRVSDAVRADGAVLSDELPVESAPVIEEPGEPDPTGEAASPAEAPIDWAVVEPAPEPVAAEHTELDHTTPDPTAAEEADPVEETVGLAESTAGTDTPFEPATTFTTAPEPEVQTATADDAVAEPEPEASVEPEPVAAAEPALVFDVDLVDAEATAPHLVVDLTEPSIDLDAPAVDPGSAPEATVVDGDAEAATTVAPPRLVTAEDIESTSPDEWIDELRDASSSEPRTEELLFAPAETPENDHFLDQLREAVAADEPEEFGEDALAAFFDEGEGGNDKSWFNRRR